MSRTPNPYRRAIAARLDELAQHLTHQFGIEEPEPNEVHIHNVVRVSVGDTSYLYTTWPVPDEYIDQPDQYKILLHGVCSYFRIKHPNLKLTVQFRLHPIPPHVIASLDYIHATMVSDATMVSEIIEAEAAKKKP